MLVYMGRFLSLRWLHFLLIWGDKMKYEFSDIMTTGEAAERWGLSPVSIKHLCTGIQGRPPRLSETECRKSGKGWLVTRQGMERLYGRAKNAD